VTRENLIVGVAVLEVAIREFREALADDPKMPRLEDRECLGPQDGSPTLPETFVDNVERKRLEVIRRPADTEYWSVTEVLPQCYD
jgi:hypothetical protein